MKKILFLLLTAFLLQSCDSEDKVQLVTIGKKYSIAIPSFLKETNDLNEEASLQYQHLWKELYVIVLDEPKSNLSQAIKDNNMEDFVQDNFEGYANFILNSLIESFKDNEEQEIIDTTINGMPAKITFIEGSVEGIDIFYKVGLFEGRTRYYQVLTWTLPSKKNDHVARMNKILYSMKEVDKRKSKKKQ